MLLLGLLQAQYTYTGYDTSAHGWEGTQDASGGGPRSGDVDHGLGRLRLHPRPRRDVRDPELRPVDRRRDLRRQAGLARLLGLEGGEVVLFITVVAQLYCGMSSITSASRMLYAFSRDGGTPGHRIWRRLNGQRVPYMAVLAIAVLAFLCAFPAYFSKDIGVGAGYMAYAAVTSIATIGLYIAYAMPIYLRLRMGDAWEPGEWKLGRWYKPIGTIAVIWVASSRCCSSCRSRRRGIPSRTGSRG